jgi:hypothetical protein
MWETYVYRDGSNETKIIFKEKLRGELLEEVCVVIPSRN